MAIKFRTLDQLAASISSAMVVKKDVNKEPAFFIDVRLLARMLDSHAEDGVSFTYSDNEDGTGVLIVEDI